MKSRSLSRLRDDRNGVTAIEAALLLPVLVLAMVGIAQLGILYFAHSGLRNLVAEGARFATVSPRPTDPAIKARIQQGGFGLVQERISAPVISYGKEGQADYADIELSYSVRLNFIFWNTDPIELTERRRVFLYPDA